MASSRRQELRRGLAATAPYLLSHHTAEERDRCHRLTVGDRTVFLCARCSGIYPGIALGLSAFTLGIGRAVWLPVVALGPLPALIDWAVTSGVLPCVEDRRGTNRRRTATGAPLGAAYGLAAPWFVTTRNPVLLAVAVAYAVMAALGLWQTTQ
jgi:uncharacterized membrane protein